MACPSDAADRVSVGGVPCPPQANFLARRFLSDDGLDLAVVPEFENVENGPTLVHLFTLVHKPGSAL